MERLIYYFIFENDYMDDIIRRLCFIFNISQEKNSIIYKDDFDQAYVLNADGEGLACVLAANSSYVYAVYIFSKAAYQKEIEGMLSDLCDEIEDEYGDDRRKLINSITLDSDVLGDCIKTAKKFGFNNILECYLI